MLEKQKPETVKAPAIPKPPADDVMHWVHCKPYEYPTLCSEKFKNWVFCSAAWIAVQKNTQQQVPSAWSGKTRCEYLPQAAKSKKIRALQLGRDWALIKRKKVLESKPDSKQRKGGNITLLLLLVQSQLDTSANHAAKDLLRNTTWTSICTYTKRKLWPVWIVGTQQTAPICYPFIKRNALIAKSFPAKAVIYSLTIICSCIATTRNSMPKTWEFWEIILQQCSVVFVHCALFLICNFFSSMPKTQSLLRYSAIKICCLCTLHIVLDLYLKHETFKCIFDIFDILQPGPSCLWTLHIFMTFSFALFPFSTFCRGCTLFQKINMMCETWHMYWIYFLVIEYAKKGVYTNLKKMVTLSSIPIHLWKLVFCLAMW